MRLDQLISIGVWNLERGNAPLGGKVDFDLEIRMLSEEKNEFYIELDQLISGGSDLLGTDQWYKLVAKMADAIADLQFVYGGTVSKISRAVLTMPDTRQSASLQQFVQNELNLMVQIFTDMTSPYGNVNLDECLDLVIDANQKKGKDKVNGKIQKGPDWVDPVIEIEKYIREQLSI